MKSSSRWPTTHSVAVSRAYSGYIEYVGAKLSAHRPGPPNACSSWSMTSLEPLAAHTMSGVMPEPPEEFRYDASAVRRSANSRSGYRLSVAAASPTDRAMSATHA